MLCFLISGWPEAERWRVAHAIFELSVRLGLRFGIVSDQGRVPSGARCVSYTYGGGGDLPFAWGQPCAAQDTSLGQVWAPNGEPDLIAGTADLLLAAHERGLAKRAYDKLGRIRPERHPLAIAGVLTTPLVEHAAALLGDLLRRAGCPVERFSYPWPSAARRAVVVSHDVDGPRLQSWRALTRYFGYGFLLGAGDGRASFAYGALTRLFDRPDPQWTFEQWRRLEDRVGLRSTFFVYPGSTVAPRDLRDPDYEPGKPAMAREIAALASNGWEIAVHTGLRASNLSEYVNGRQYLGQVAGQPVVGVRPHYWGKDWTDPLATWRSLDAAGYAYDAGANPGTLGFRFGTSMPFMPSFAWRGDCDGLIVMPTAIMDSYAVKRTSPLPAPDRERALSAIEAAGAIENGFLMLDWHERVLANLGVWKGFMGPLLERLNAWRDDSATSFLTAGEAAAAWRAHARRCYVPLEPFRPVLP